MTENQWARDGYGTPMATQQTPLRPETTFPPGPAGSSSGSPAGSGTAKTDAAKDEAAGLTHQAADSAHTVAETAKTEAAHVAEVAQSNAKDLLHQAKSDLTDQAGAQQQKVAEGLRSISTELSAMAAASDQPGVATDLVRQAAERSSAVASWLDGRDPGSLLTEVKSFARQRPGTFLLLAAGAGVLAGRLSRSLSAGAPGPAAAGPGTPERVPDTGAAVPPPPVQLPAPETTTAGLAGTYPPSPLDDGPRQDRRETETSGSGLLGQDPLTTAEPLRTPDQFRDDPFDGGRR